MNPTRPIQNIALILGLLLVQVLVLNNLDLGFGMLIMVYPLISILLPLRISPILELVIAFFLGMIVDSFANTFGLHTTSMLTMALLRPTLVKAIAPSEVIEDSLPILPRHFGRLRYFLFIAILLLTHHLWFFIFEYLEVTRWPKAGLNALLSLPLSMGVGLLLYYLLTPTERAK